MRKSIFKYFIIVLIVTLISSCALTATLVSKMLLERTKHDMLYSLNLIVYALNDETSLQNQVMELNPLAYSDETRITIVDLQGNVLADTEKNTIYENHYEREEIQKALLNEVGYASRKSETTDFNTLYVALLSDKYIVRLSIPYDGIMEFIPVLVPALAISATVSFLIALILSRKLSYRISKPILEINEGLENMSSHFEFQLNQYDYQEFNNIVNTIDNLSERLRKSIQEVKLEKRKIEEVLTQMNEGFILLDENYKVLSINAKAMQLFKDLNIDKNIIDYKIYPEIIDALKQNVYKQVVEIKIEDNVYAVYISKVKLGTTLLFLDVTASKTAEKMRREFFSNVSHELKTPMTSIRGYSELLANGYIKDEAKQREMLNKILVETDNISTLINDILLLSRLENMELHDDMVSMNINRVIEEVIDSYEVEIERHQISVDRRFNDIKYIGNPKQIHTLLNNLIGNAIKYNKENGSVSVSVEEESNAIKITVSDTGIGIPLSDQPRIFERFYRVDKGRSKLQGGNGLGLAIVKHIVTNYKGTIRLESEVNKGTTIEIVLPQQTSKKEV